MMSDGDDTLYTPEKVTSKKKKKSVLNTQHFKPHAAQLQLIWARRTYGL